jgi:superfamily II RNA helicase
VIKPTLRPVPHAHLFYTARSGAFEPKDIDRIRKRELMSAARLGRMAHKKRSRDGGDGQRGRREMQEPPDARPLIDQLQRHDLLPALVFAFSRKDCERLAWSNAGRELLDVVETERMQALQEQLIALFQLDHAFLDSELLTMARHGLSYHHAGMLPIHKELVERMFTSGLLKLLFTTETFALGINMPARSVVFHSLRKFDGVSFDYLSTRDYMQMAGRAGRQGLDTEGLVYSLLSPKDLAEAPLKRLIAGRAEPVESRFGLAFSSILHLVERLGRARLIEAWEKSFNQFQHRASTRKRQEQNRRDQRRLLDAHVAFLEELGYLHGDELTARGRIAKLINGYELQVTELCFGGLLENLPVDALAVVIVGLIYEERRRGEQGWISSKLHGNVRTSVQREIHALGVKAAEHQISGSIKMPDWGLTTVTQAWVSGTSFDDILEHADMTPGDIVRTFRMAVQLMRQIRRAIDPTWDLHDRLGRAMDALNRDVVDARRQLELG